jgi:glucose/arabinose dehydrogenase
MSLSVRRCLLFLVVALPLIAHAQRFRVDTLARGPLIQLPSAIAFLPGSDDKFFFAERSTGRVRLYDGSVHPGSFLTVPVEDESEQGLLGLAVHPLYPDSPFVYVYYVRAVDRAGILERYRDQEGEGVSPQLLLFIARRDEATQNNGGTLRFGPDGKLYVAVGDHGARPSNAQDTLGGRNLRGKILRLNPDGTVPYDNPFPRRYFWSIGFRDPSALGFDPANGRLYVTEGGSLTNEVIVVPRGANLGWPGRQMSAPEGEPAPAIIYSAAHGDQPGFTGIAVYRGELFPQLNGKILLAGNSDPTLWAGKLSADGDSLSLESLYRSNTGFSDVHVGPDGCIYLANGPYRASRIVRLSPLPPQFASAPPLNAVLGERYIYTPSFLGTPPGLEVLDGPEGMKIDSTDWSVHWIPTKTEALIGKQTVAIRARNGAGTADQKFTLTVQNINEPPTPSALVSPADGSERRFLGEDPYLTFSWTPAHDPDLDTVRYLLQVDTVSTFSSRFLLNIDAGTSDSLRIALPQSSSSYYWRVVATDGRSMTLSVPHVSRVEVIFSKFLGREKSRHVESVIEQTFSAPLTPEPSIRYSVPRPGYVRLTVFNILGQEVARLYDGMQQAGTYEVGIASLNVPSGIYFYRLIAPGFAETKKIVVAR